MLRKLYDWAIEKVSRPEGEKWLGILSFAEASFFPVPPDVLLMPMIFADRSRAWRLATITTVASIIGAMLGYVVGAFLFDAVAAPLLDFYGYTEKFGAFETYYQEYGVLIILIGGLTPIPFKVIAIASGVFGLNPLLFLATCIPARAPRFFVVAGLLYFFGAPIRRFVEAYLPWVVTAITLIGIGGFLALKWL